MSRQAFREKAEDIGFKKVSWSVGCLDSGLTRCVMVVSLNEYWWFGKERIRRRDA